MDARESLELSIRHLEAACTQLEHALDLAIELRQSRDDLRWNIYISRIREVLHVNFRLLHQLRSARDGQGDSHENHL